MLPWMLNGTCRSQSIHLPSYVHQNSIFIGEYLIGNDACGYCISVTFLRHPHTLPMRLVCPTHVYDSAMTLWLGIRDGSICAYKTMHHPLSVCHDFGNKTNRIHVTCIDLFFFFHGIINEIIKGVSMCHVRSSDGRNMRCRYWTQNPNTFALFIADPALLIFAAID